MFSNLIRIFGMDFSKTMPYNCKLGCIICKFPFSFHQKTNCHLHELAKQSKCLFIFCINIGNRYYTVVLEMGLTGSMDRLKHRLKTKKNTMLLALFPNN